MRIFSNAAWAVLFLLGSFTAATAQSVWTLRNPLPAYKSLQAMTTTGTQLVAVGDSGTVLTSVTGGAWTKRVPVTGAILYGVASGNGVLVAVGVGGVVLTSPDGVAWTTRNSGVTATLNGVTWTGSLFVAVGAAGTILTSPNGIDWTPRPVVGLTTVLNSVAGSTGLIVAVGEQGRILTSANGTDWTSQNSGTAAILYGVGSGGGLFVAVGASGTIRTSADGLTWDTRTSGITTYLSSVRYANGLFVAVGNSGNVLTSPNGITWSAPQTSNTLQPLRGVAWTGTQWAAVGVAGVIRLSLAGDVWADPSPTTVDLNAVAYAANQPIVAVGNGGVIVSSSDSGASWTLRTSGVATVLNGAAWGGSGGNSVCVVVGNSGTVLTSANGLTWTTRTFGVGNHILGITWTGTHFVAVGASGIARTSPDGISWTPRTSSTTNQLYSVTWTGSRIVAVGLAGTVVTSASSDGTATWATQTSGTGTTTLTSVTWAGTQVIAVGQTGALRTSPDGISWTGRTSGVTDALNAVGWSGSLAAALTTSGRVLTSADGVAWVSQPTGTNSTLHALAWPFGNVVVVGVGGAIVTSPQVSVPAVPTLDAPANTASSVSVFATLSWHPSQGALSYRLQVSTVQDFATLVFNDTVSATSRMLPTLSGNTMYYWKVSASNAVGSSAFSASRSFTTAAAPTTPPPAPALSSPELFATGVPVPVTLGWGASNGAETYHVQISTSPATNPTTGAFTTTVFVDSGITALSRLVTGLSGGTDYYWHVRAKNGLGAGGWSDTWTFKTAIPLPGVPTLTSPGQFAPGVSRNPTLVWEPVSGALTYRVQLSTSSDFTAPFAIVAEDSTVTGVSWAPPITLGATTMYYWHVRAKNAVGVSAYSGTFMFTTGTTAVRPGPGLAQVSRFGGAGYLRFSLARPEHVTARLYDMQGRLAAVILDETRAEGAYTVALPRGLGESLYFLEFRLGAQREWMTIHP